MRYSIIEKLLMGLAGILTIAMIFVTVYTHPEEFGIVSAAEEIEFVTVADEAEPVPERIDCPLNDETQQMILDKCKLFAVDFPLVMAVINQESSFDVDAVGDNGKSLGLMQINEFNFQWLYEEYELSNFLDADENVTAGLIILKKFLIKYEEPEKALMAYSLGETGAKEKWNQGIYSTAYTQSVLEQAEKYERMINNDIV